jgi:diguanylate cyclase (GGDEF)-like protein
MAAALLIVLGFVGSFLGASAVARGGVAKSRQASITTSTAIATGLEVAIQHEKDLVTSVASFIAYNPAATQIQFKAEMTSVHAFESYPELQGLAELVLVPASQLVAFTQKENASLARGETFHVQPPGARSYYCFITLFQSHTLQLSALRGVDMCDSKLGSLIMKTRDTGEAAYLPYGAGLLILGQPIFLGNLVPGTVQLRKDAFIGWVGMQITPGVVLSNVLKSYPKVKAVFRYEGASFSQTFQAGSTTARSYVNTINLHDGWYLKTFGVASARGVSGSSGAAGVLWGGTVLSLLLGLSLYVLGAGRARSKLLEHERTKELHFQAFHDSLTGLANRDLVLDRAGKMLARSRRDGTSSALLFLDLDDFKDVNDTLGHVAGDQLLRAVAARLASSLREVDTVGRLGGDEFVVLVDGASLTEGVQVVLQRIFDMLGTPFEIAADMTPVVLTASIGVAEGDRATPEELLRDADIALNQAKVTGKAHAVYFIPSMRDAIEVHRNLDLELHRALENGEFFLLYQPTVDLLSGTITGVEALLRWRHPERGVVQPNDFIPLLESSGLIIPVGQWVLDAACRQGARWHIQNHSVTVAVNLAAAQLGRNEIVDEVQAVLAASGFDPGKLVLEITESTLMLDVENTLARLERLKAIGVRIAIDDFGTGYSSFARLRRFPIDILKIDRSFVAGMVDSPDSAAIVHTLVQLGKLLGLETIAEGVETDEQRIWLKAEKVDIGQGYLFARPLDVEDVNRLMENADIKPPVVRIRR